MNENLETWRRADGTIREQNMDILPGDYFGPAPQYQREIRAYRDAEMDYYDSDRFDPSCW